MRFGLDVAQHQLEWPTLLERVRFAERSGFEGVWAFDHFRPLYGRRDGPCMEGWSVLAALAAATERVRLGVLVTGVTYRHPSVLAMQAATIDHISRGRLDFGIGAAWNVAEHRQLGIPFPRIRERAERLAEAVEVYRSLLSGDRASFQGRHYSLDGATYRPRPVQRPHPPVWIGASGERVMLPVVARHADVWHDAGPVREHEPRSAQLDGRAGRAPAQIRRAASLSLSRPWDAVRGEVEALARIGFDYLVVSYPSEGQARLEEFVGRVMPGLR
jgi:alkanesulfonate monooxygenase SsuD/methylene tetrahydromethanopterin reductase-like flavin-dependent oxidoreductase (luciferase family)